MIIKQQVTKPNGLSEEHSHNMTYDASPPSNTPTNAVTALRTLDSSAILGDQDKVLIHHLGEIYRLQTTRQGKLILTK